MQVNVLSYLKYLKIYYIAQLAERVYILYAIISPCSLRGVPLYSGET